MAIEHEGNTSRPGVVIIAIIALLLVAGVAIWFTQREPTIERDTTTSTTTTEGTTTVREVEPPSSTPSDQTTPTENTNPIVPPPDSTGY